LVCWWQVRNVRANDLLQMFDRVGDPFANKSAQGSEKSDKANENAMSVFGGPQEETQATHVDKKPFDGYAKMGADEDKTIVNTPPRTQEQGASDKTADKTLPPATQQTAAPKEERPVDRSAKPSNERNSNEKNASERSTDRRSGDRDRAETGARVVHAAHVITTAIERAVSAVLVKMGIVPDAQEKALDKEAKELTQQLRDAQRAAADKQQVVKRPDAGNAGAEQNAFSNAFAASAPDAQQAQQLETAQELKKDADARRFQETKEDAKAGGELKKGEAKETKESRDVERGHGRAAELVEEDPGNGVGAGWVQENIEAAEQEQREAALRLEDALGASFRCHGIVEDGTRCLRKPVQGTPYCREHASTIFGPQQDTRLEGAGGASEVAGPDPELAGIDPLSLEIDPVAGTDPLVPVHDTQPDVRAYGSITTD
jgi:hypothetical protein